jgi:glycosyltransferase involved in cell wall biosynthesis
MLIKKKKDEIAIKILFFSYYFLPHVGAATWSTYYLSQSLLRRGHSINLIIPNVRYSLSINDRKSTILEKKIPLKLNRTPRYKMPQKIAPLISFLLLLFKGLSKGRNSDIILCQFHPHHFAHVVALIIGRIFHIPVVVRANDIYRKINGEVLYNRISKLVSVFNEYFIKYTKAFLVVCSENKEILLSRLGKNASKYHIDISHNGVDQSLVNNTLNKEEARKLLNLTQERIILFVGRFSSKRYGIDILLKAMSKILIKIPNSLLILVGDKMTVHQKELINSLGISKHIRVYGPRSHNEIFKFIIASEICIGPLMPTLAIPQKVLEYMACSKPIVTGIKSVSRDLNPHVNFLVVSPEPNSVADAIIKILDNEDFARKLGEKGKGIISNFTWDKIGVDLEKILLKTIRV